MSKVLLQDASGLCFRYSLHLKPSLMTTTITLPCQYVEITQKAVLLQETMWLIFMKQKALVYKGCPILERVSLAFTCCVW